MQEQVVAPYFCNASAFGLLVKSLALPPLLDVTSCAVINACHLLSL